MEGAEGCHSRGRRSGSLAGYWQTWKFPYSHSHDDLTRGVVLLSTGMASSHMGEEVPESGSGGVMVGLGFPGHPFNVFGKS